MINEVNMFVIVLKIKKKIKPFACFIDKGF
jgi:hypothetical protein